MKSGGRREGEGVKGVCRLAVTSCSLICEMKHLAQAATATRTSNESESPPQQNRTEMSFESCMRHTRGKGQAQGCSGAKSLNRFANELPLNRLSLSLNLIHPTPLVLPSNQLVFSVPALICLWPRGCLTSAPAWATVVRHLGGTYATTTKQNG